jgi:hypothetical protein
MLKSTYTRILAAAFGLALATTVKAQVLLGGFQGPGDPTDAGWIDVQAGVPITTSTSCTFPTGVVSNYTQSLAISVPTNHAGAFGWPTLQLQMSAAQITAFYTNSWITFTFSVPAWTNGGYSQIYNLVLNAPGYGYNNQSWANALEMGATNNTTPGGDPNYYFYNGVPARTMVVSYNYSSVLAAIQAGISNSVATNGASYLQLTFQGNQGGGAPVQPAWYMNSVVLSQTAFGTAPSGIVYTVDDFSTNGVSPSNPVGGDYLAAGAFSYAPTNGITNVWSEWFGNGGPGGTAPSFSFNPNEDVSGNTNSSGAMQINFTWNAGPDGYQQWNMWHGNANTYCPTNAGGTVGISYPTYTNVECDVKFDPSSVTNANGDYGVLRIGIRGVGDFVNQSWLAYFTITDTNWHHLSAMIPSSNPDSLNIADPIVGEDVNSSVGNGGLTGNQILYVDNIKFTGALSTPPLPPPTVKIQPATPGLRIYAGSAANTFDRATITAVNQAESWIGATYPVTYSFSLLTYPNNNINQTMVQLIPVNTGTGQAPLGGAYPSAGNQYFDYQNSNGVWLVLAPNGAGRVTATVEWKVGTPNANPNHTEMVFTNPTALGTWTWTFNSPSNGTVSAPGGMVEPFVIGDTNVSADFANPLIAVFGLQPNSMAGEGMYEDWGMTAISGTGAGSVTDDWTHQSKDFNPNGGLSGDNLWSPQGSANPQEIVVARNGLDAYWITWTAPQPGTGFGVVVGTNLLTSPSTWSDPAWFANNTDFFPPRANSSVLLGPIYLTVMPFADLPTANHTQQPTPPAITVPLAPNAYFIGSTNYNNQYF